MQYIIWFIILLFIIGQCSKKDNTSYTPRANSSSYSTSYTPSLSTANSTKTTTPTPSTSTIQSKPQTKTTNESKNCDPNYTWCVPIASDVDCAGWRGNWPEYVRWPIRVIWRDIYDLDRDGDGIWCEK